MAGRTALSTALALLLGLGLGSTAAAEGEALFSFGMLNASGGPADRSFGSLALTMAAGSRTTLHFETAYQSREEDAGYVAVGLSRDFGNGGSARFLIGTSNSALGIYPELALDASYQYDAGPQQGRLYRVGVVYDDFAPGNSSTRLRGEVVQYFAPRSDGSYFVGQLGGTLTFAEPGSETGWEVSAVGTMANPGGTSVGVELSAGTMAYDLIPAIPVANNFYAIRPFVSFALGSQSEVILRGEYVDSELYNLAGASIGFKLGF